MDATERNAGGGVVGFGIAFLAFAFGGALGLPESVRLLVIGAGVLLAVLSAGMRGLGLAALVLGGVTVISSIVLFGAVGASRDLQVTPSTPTFDDTTGVDDTTGPQEDGSYALTPQDKQFIEASWGRRSDEERQAICALIRDGISDAQLQETLSRLEQIPPEYKEGLPTEETEALAYLRAGYAYTETELC